MCLAVHLTRCPSDTGYTSERGSHCTLWPANKSDCVCHFPYHCPYCMLSSLSNIEPSKAIKNKPETCIDQMMLSMTYGLTCSNLCLCCDCSCADAAEHPTSTAECKKINLEFYKHQEVSSVVYAYAALGFYNLELLQVHFDKLQACRTHIHCIITTLNQQHVASDNLEACRIQIDCSITLLNFLLLLLPIYKLTKSKMAALSLC